MSNNRSSIQMSSDVMNIVKNLSKKVSDQINSINKEANSKNVANLLGKIQKNNEKNKSARESILDLKILNNKGEKTIEKERLLEILCLDKDIVENSSYISGKSNNLEDGESNYESKSISRNYENKNKIKYDKNREFYEKQQEYINKSNLKINRMRKEKYELDMKEQQNKPKINKVSKELTKKQRNASVSSLQHFNEEKSVEINVINDDYLFDKPFYLRSQEIMLKRDEKKDKLKKLYEMIEIEKENRIVKKKNNKKYNEIEFEKWIEEKLKWKARKEKLAKKLKEQNEKKELEEAFSYKPYVNDVSNELFNNKYQDKEFLDRSLIYMEEKEKKREKIIEQTTHSFNPYVNKRSKKMNKNNSSEFKKSIFSSSPKNRNSISVIKENPIIARKSLKMDEENINKNVKNQAKKRKLSQYSQFIDLESPPKSKNFNNNESVKDTSTYSVNIRDNSAWDENKENVLNINNKYSGLMYDLLN